MSILKTLVLATAATIFLIGVGCDVVALKYPLPNAGTSSLDPRLLGHWEEQPAPRHGTSAAWCVTKHPKFDRAVFFLDPAGPSATSGLSLFVATVDGKKYLSCQFPDLRTMKKCYFLYRYEMSDEDTVHLWPLSKDAIREAIAAKRLSGQITVSTTRGGFFGGKSFRQQTDVRVTAGPEELREFVAKHGDSCFSLGDDPVVLGRTK